MSLPIGVSLGDGTVILLLADPYPVSSANADSTTASADFGQRSFMTGEMQQEQAGSEN